MDRPEPASAAAQERARFVRAVRALRKYRARVARRLERLQADLAEAERAPQFRRFGETLLTYLKQVPARAERVTLPDPQEPELAHDIALEPKLNAQGNAARYFKRAAKAERGLKQVPPRLAACEAELHALGEPFRFDGERGCACRLIGGPARAFNLMVRRGDARGSVVVADGAPVAAGPIRFGVCYAARGASECLLPGRAPIPVESGHALVVDGEAQSTSMHVNPIDPGAVAIVATLDANGRAADAR